MTVMTVNIEMWKFVDTAVFMGMVFLIRALSLESKISKEISLDFKTSLANAGWVQISYQFKKWLLVKSTNFS